ncbi:MAG: hypothetical protein Q7S63_01280 [bacterium]|nr:hypothetical protein [bacterium]
MKQSGDFSGGSQSFWTRRFVGLFLIIVVVAIAIRLVSAGQEQTTPSISVAVPMSTVTPTIEEKAFAIQQESEGILMRNNREAELRAVFAGGVPAESAAFDISPIFRGGEVSAATFMLRPGWFLVRLVETQEEPVLGLTDTMRFCGRVGMDTTFARFCSFAVENKGTIFFKPLMAAYKDLNHSVTTKELTP